MFYFAFDCAFGHCCYVYFKFDTLLYWPLLNWLTKRNVLTKTKTQLIGEHDMIPSVKGWHMMMLLIDKLIDRDFATFKSIFFISKYHKWKNFASLQSAQNQVQENSLTCHDTGIAFKFFFDGPWWRVLEGIYMSTYRLYNPRIQW